MRKKSPGAKLETASGTFGGLRPLFCPQTPARGQMLRACAVRHRSCLHFALLVVGYAVYLLLGAWIFSAIELPYEEKLRQELIAAREDFLSNNTCVSDARLEELLVRALEASNYGVSVLRNDNTHNWDFVSSLFFTSTVLTTTGEAGRDSSSLAGGGK